MEPCIGSPCPAPEDVLYWTVTRQAKSLPLDATEATCVILHVVGRPIPFSARSFRVMNSSRISVRLGRRANTLSLGDWGRSGYFCKDAHPRKPSHPSARARRNAAARVFTRLALQSAGGRASDLPQCTQHVPGTVTNPWRAPNLDRSPFSNAAFSRPYEQSPSAEHD